MVVRCRTKRRPRHSEVDHDPEPSVLAASPFNPARTTRILASSSTGLTGWRPRLHARAHQPASGSSGRAAARWAAANPLPQREAGRAGSRSTPETEVRRPFRRSRLTPFPLSAAVAKRQTWGQIGCARLARSLAQSASPAEGCSRLHVSLPGPSSGTPRVPRRQSEPESQPLPCPICQISTSLT